MDKKVVKELLLIRVAALLKEGKSLNEAFDIASEEIKDEWRKVEFETYQSEHDC